MKNNTIYHYCSLQTFFKLISGVDSNLKKANIRLYHTDSMDDSFDNKLVNTQINKILIETGQENKYITSSCDIYIACFANTNTNEYLWDKYADHNKGVCIGFNFPYATNGSKFESQDSEFLYIQEIEYTTEDKIKLLVNKYIEKFKSLSIGNEKRITIDDIIIRFYPEWFYELFKKNHFSKLEKFKPEQEIRLVYRTNRRKFDIHLPNERKPKELSNVQYGIKKVNKKEVLATYFELQIHDYISEITIGKECSSNKINISSFLEYHLNRRINVK